MDTLTATLISSAVAIVVAVIGVIASNRRLEKTLSVHDRSSEKNKELLSKEHSVLEKDISQGTVHIVGAINTAGKEVSEVRTTLTTLKDKFIESEAENRVHFLSLSDAQRRLYTSAEDMGKFAAEFSVLAAENKQLRDENSALKQRNQELTKRLSENGLDPDREDEWEPER